MRETITATSRGLLVDSFPYRLYQKAKRVGTWNPADIDFTKDATDWKQATPGQRHSILRLLSQFQAGEEAVTLDLLPLMMAIAKEGRIEEEMFLTTFLFEEAKHTEFFRAVLDAIGEKGELNPLLTDTYKQVFQVILPNAMDRLLTDQSPEAIADASTVYNMFVEGVLAETGYFSFYQSLEKSNLMPGLLEGIGNLKRDESRHIGYGTYLLQRLICEHPHIYDDVVMKRMAELTPMALTIVEEGLTDADIEAFGTSPEEVVNFSMKQLQIRMDILSRARGKKIEEIYRTSESEVGMI
ncbi:MULTISPECIES: R2-like ligand-binding oxidase [unclassified Bacillus (in: firmicutes)]|uniref:R2-like ligand-binding oxidase n=1 Tax=unclassified Bacillus (in: firmicutes) TaxID=185979 RepID=UPI00080ACEBB|nr:MULTISPECIES: R2-like ligand-binding oxidase [unclassified Bacillus (in: firmicutes)]OCA89543.1 ribonucleotide-diphosphate reductase [Bacillus sp. FJAT-27986]